MDLITLTAWSILMILTIIGTTQQIKDHGIMSSFFHLGVCGVGIATFIVVIL